MTPDDLPNSLTPPPRRREGLSMLKRIVVIDDHPLTIHALKSVLERDAMLRVVDCARDGASGLVAWRAHRPDLLVVDLELPGMNGLDLVRRVRVSDAAVRILVFSARTSALAAPAARQAGADGYLHKTGDHGALLQAARTLLAGRACFPKDGTAAGAGDPLTQKETRIMAYLAKGHSNKDIALALSLSNKTISSHKIRILSKLGLNNVVDLSHYARSQGHAD